MQGHTDIPLNQEGQKQALSLQSFFSENTVDLFISSDLCRAQETTKIANMNLGKPVLVSEVFREVCLGDLEGLTLNEAHAQFGLEAWEKWISMNPENFHFRYPRAESVHEAVARFAQGLRNICLTQNFRSAGLCTHGLIMRRFLHSLRPDLKEELPIPNCVVYKIKWQPSGSFSFDLVPG